MLYIPWVIIFGVMICGVGLAIVYGMHDKFDSGVTIEKVNKVLKVMWWLLLFVVIFSSVLLLIVFINKSNILFFGALMFWVIGIWELWILRPSTWPVANDETNWPTPNKAKQAGTS